MKAKEAEMAVIKIEALQRRTEMTAHMDEQAALIAELQYRLSKKNDDIQCLEGRVEELIDEKTVLEGQLLSVDSERDTALTEAVAASIEKSVAIAAGKEQSRVISELSRRVDAQEAELVSTRTSLQNAVEEYQTSADFSAAISESCAEGSRWMKDALIAALPHMADCLRLEAEAFMTKTFLDSEEIVATPRTGEENDPSSSKGKHV